MSEYYTDVIVIYKTNRFLPLSKDLNAVAVSKHRASQAIPLQNVVKRKYRNFVPDLFRPKKLILL